MFAKNKITMLKLLDKTVGEIVASDYRTADIFRNYNIDFCCGGKAKLSDVCSKKNIEITQIILELNELNKVVKNEPDFSNMPVEQLTAHIVNVHHSYVEQHTILLKQYGSKVVSVHGQHHTELIEIVQLFESLATELALHMKKEEFILFPFINALAKAKQTGSSIQKTHFKTIENPIEMMELEHDVAGDIMTKIAYLSDNFTPPLEACNTYKVYFAKLQEFEKDLHVHIHLENNILFPKAILLEKSFITTN